MRVRWELFLNLVHFTWNDPSVVFYVDQLAHIIVCLKCYQGGDYFPKLFRNLIQVVQISSGIESFGKIIFCTSQSTYSFCKSKWQIFGPSDHWGTQKSKFQKSNKLHAITPRSFYADHYSQNDYTLKSNCKTDICHNMSLYPKTLCGRKMIVLKIYFSKW